MGTRSEDQIFSSPEKHQLLDSFWVASKHSTYYPNLRLNEGRAESKFNISLVNYQYKEVVLKKAKVPV